MKENLHTNLHASKAFKSCSPISHMNNGAQHSMPSQVYGWKSNPFAFMILPELFTGHKEEVSKILGSISEGTKFLLLVGPTGSGKTTLLKYLDSEIENSHAIYLPKPPTDPKDFVEIFTEVLKPDIISRLLHKNGVSVYNLGNYVNKKLNSKRCVLLIDECHEASLHTLEWLRVLTDQINNLTIVLSGLPTFENMLKENLETLRRRINVKIELGSLTKDETLEMVRKRIEAFGGTDIKPFTLESINYIYEKTGGFPRDILKTCDELAQMAASKKLSMIDKDFLRYEDPLTKEMKKATHSDFLDSLPEKQKYVLELLAKQGGMTPAEIAVKLGAKSYKDKENAVRSTNNIVKRLLKDHILVRKKSGKAFKYDLAHKIKTLFVSA